MIFKMLSIGVVCLFCLTACSGQNSIDQIKLSSLPQFSKNKSLGEAFDSYKFCANSKWAVGSTTGDNQIVVFTCDMPYIVEFAKQGIEGWMQIQPGLTDVQARKQNPGLFVKSAGLKTEFTIYKKERRWEVTGMWTNICWDDGKCASVQHDNFEKINNVESSFKRIYANQPLWTHDSVAFGVVLGLSHALSEQ